MVIDTQAKYRPVHSQDRALAVGSVHALQPRQQSIYPHPRCKELLAQLYHLFSTTRDDLVRGTLRCLTSFRPRFFNGLQDVGGETLLPLGIQLVEILQMPSFPARISAPWVEMRPCMRLSS